MDALWDGDGGAAALTRGAAGGVTACAAWRHFGRHWGRHTDRFTGGQEEEAEAGRKARVNALKFT